MLKNREGGGMRINKELLKGSVISLVLTVLDRKDMYGYDLIKEIEKISSGAVVLKDGTLYPMLHTLEKSGSVESYWVEKKNARPRKYYRITKPGRAVLKKRTKEWEDFKTAMDQVLLGAKIKVCES